MSGYSIKWSKIALEELNKLPSEIVERITKKLDAVKENPFHFLEKLVNILGYKVRIGDYRVLIDVIGTEKILAIRTLGHRKNIYKKYGEN